MMGSRPPMSVNVTGISAEGMASIAILCSSEVRVSRGGGGRLGTGLRSLQERRRWGGWDRERWAVLLSE